MKTSVKEITSQLLDNLWDQYLKRMPFARTYVRMVTEKKGRVIHDHLAFRTLNTHTGEQPEGIDAIGHLIRILGYSKAGKYQFPKQHITAFHYEHPDPELPKIFISQLEVDQFPEWVHDLIHDQVTETPYLLSDQGIGLLNSLQQNGLLPFEAAEILVEELTRYFTRPWGMVRKDTVLKINEVSQYAAWTLLHGNSVNHFAASVNQHQIQDWPDLESTLAALGHAGVSLKDSIEGEKGSKLRQSATFAVIEETQVIHCPDCEEEEIETVDAQGEQDVEKIDWTYAYYEFVERGYTDVNNEKVLFSGFITEQTSHLFGMTRITGI